MIPNPQHMLPVGTTVESLPRKHTVLISAVGFVIGIAVASVWFTGIDLHKQNAVSSTSTTTTANLDKNSFPDELSVQDQAAGAQVLVSSVDIPSPGVWVVIAEMRGDDLGNILGAARALGPVKNLSVDLQRATLPGRTYAVVLYREDGDGVFNYQADSVYIDWNTEKRVAALFKTNP